MAEIAQSPRLMLEAQHFLPEVMQAAKREAGVAGVTEILAQHFALYPQPERTKAEWSAWWKPYLDVLESLPYASLKAAMAAWVRDPASEFLPKPGKLLELALHAVTPEITAYARLGAAMRYKRPFLGEPIPVEPPRLRSVQDIAAVRRMAADWRKQTEEAAPPAYVFDTQGQVDETGITPEARALIAKQRGEG